MYYKKENIMSTINDEARKIAQYLLQERVRLDGPIPWGEFQRLASSAYGTGAVGKLQNG